MIYPNNFESKIGFGDIRQLLRSKCLSTLGKEMTDNISLSTNPDTINEWLTQVREFRLLTSETDSLPLNYFFDVRESVARLRLEGTHLEADELFDLRRSLDTISGLIDIFNRNEAGEETNRYPALRSLTDGIESFPMLTRHIDMILDKYGKIKDNASSTLLNIRRELASTEGSVSRVLNAILRSAQSEGLVDKDVAPTMRDGRLVIPVAPGLKRRIKGIVHDESASGKTVFIEPAEVVEANNRVRELEAEERREIIRILTEFANLARPYVAEILMSYKFLAKVDFIRAKAELAEMTGAIEPTVLPYPHIDWIRASHPILSLQLAKQGKKVVPLDIMLTKDQRILIISGPNAGGKSVCLKTVGLLQYMLQCGIPVPVGDRSTLGVFNNIMIDIGDEQSIENDLSTYSSHLTNMKVMMKNANGGTLLLIDEFGGGTEPQIGGAIAEAVLKQFCVKKAMGVITTHYQNLKHFAEDHEGVINGAMLYDRHQMQALFQLAIGQPGSSFAIEIARKTGIPEEVIADASAIVGSDYIQSDKYLQDIVRDKRYWEGKRQTIHQHERELEKKIAQYEEEIRELEKSRKDILNRAKKQAEELFKESNRRIENTIREIKEKQAEKEETRKIREALNAFKSEVLDIESKEKDELIAKKIKQIQERKQRKEDRKKEKAEKERKAAESLRAAALRPSVDKPWQPASGDYVRIKGLQGVGRIESIDGKNCTVIFGDIKSKMKTSQLEQANSPSKNDAITATKTQVGAHLQSSRMTREIIDNRKLNFHQDIDVRGMRGDEALNAVQHFIDDAIVVGMPMVRILHGTGTGVLRQLIRQLLSTIPNVTSYRDEHVQFGGAGITVVNL
ncbi:MAG: Smr/MutS family protein [Prevotella sp.]|nr:Smr/MutS family protein [Prevotella sp.]